MRRKKGLKGVSIVASLFCLVMVFWGGCIQIGRSHPCDTDKGGSVGCDGDDVCHEGWCVPKGWTGINDEVLSDSEHRAGSERSGEQFFDGGSNDKGSQYEGQTKEAWSTEQSKGNEIAGQELVLRDGCAFVCKLGESRFCFGGQSGCDVKGNCKGLCRMGKQYCHYKDGCPVWSDCFESKGPESETCNGEDDDCDGLVDEALKRSCYSGPSQTQGVGNCKDGQQSCVSGQWGACTGQQLPKAEECNKIDDDCDGQVDEGCSCSPGTTQKCGASDIGECQKGTQTCSPLGEWSSCTGEQVAGSESCNNKDDDCDGQTDEDLKRPCYGGKADTKGKGICKQGEQTCTAGNWGACIGQQLPEQEKCDGLDNDCNGSVDEADPILDRGCTSQGLGYCKPGLWKCTNKKMACTIVRVPQTETCNGKDDDCNGSVDESLKRSCYSGTAGTSGKGICKNGSEMCTNGTWGVCTGEVTPQQETCNGKDDDCDGSIDESDPIVNRSCTSLGIGYCKPGLWKCTNAKLSCEIVRTPQPESCDGVDNDCDGRLDEGCFSNLTGVLPPGFVDGGPGVAKFRSPSGLAIDSAGNLYVADGGNHCIRKVDPSGNVTTFAGNGTKGAKDGTALQAQFNYPIDLTFDSLGNLYVADQDNHLIRKIDTSGNVSTFAGSSIGFADGLGTQAQFIWPRGLAFDQQGNLYVADNGNRRIRKINASRQVTTVAGNGNYGFKNGPAMQAEFRSPTSLTFDKQGNLFITDPGNFRIQKLDTSGVVSTFSGSGLSGFRDGAPSTDMFENMQGLVFDKSGTLFVSDYGNNRIRKFDSSGNVSTFAGDGVNGGRNDFPLKSRFVGPAGLVFDSVGNLYVVDLNNGKIRKYTLP